ncbi:hypothetical protein [Pseudomonas amygdali]|uniref:Uncharacterized protein n=2 Tax=Pseudomonas amygdali pv. lachrymans TaxID=53707 RepID=A0AAD0PWI1_PSEAV|nr:hypothetical protein [Pseudomonas amygdali]AXH60059.1 hypothetical protein PLA107_033075 [Pseudomonas amygdali pv. lachrymans str. M301315]
MKKTIKKVGAKPLLLLLFSASLMAFWVIICAQRLMASPAPYTSHNLVAYPSFDEVNKRYEDWVDAPLIALCEQEKAWCLLQLSLANADDPRPMAQVDIDSKLLLPGVSKGALVSYWPGYRSSIWEGNSYWIGSQELEGEPHTAFMTNLSRVSRSLNTPPRLMQSNGKTLKHLAVLESAGTPPGAINSTSIEMAVFDLGMRTVFMAMRVVDGKGTVAIVNGPKAWVGDSSRFE